MRRGRQPLQQKTTDMEPLLPWRGRLPILIFIIGFTLFPILSHATTTFVVVNLDGPGEGFNDPAPFTPAGGNTAMTLGQARLQAFQYAAKIWGALITSAVPVLVDANMDPLPGNLTSATLGGAGPTAVFRDFTGMPLPPRVNTWYVPALANKLHGSDLDPGFSDMTAVFNSSVDSASVLGTSRWYYGLDGHTPPGDIDFVTTVLHEIGHGLGFIDLVDLASGQKFLGFDDAFMVFLENHGANPPDYPSMANAQRVTASRAAPNLHWTGANVVAVRGGHVEIYAPNPPEPGSSVSHFSTTLSPNELMEPFAVGISHNIGLAAQLLADIGWGAIAPELLIHLNAPVFTTGNALLLHAATNQGVPGSPVDVYAGKKMPDGTLMFLQADRVTFSPAALPVIPNWSIYNNFSGYVFSSIFTGTEPPGAYIMFIAFTIPGTQTVITLSTAPFSFTP